MIRIKTKDSLYEIDLDIVQLYEVMRKEEFILIGEKHILRVKDIIKVDQI
jgi:hypothetical protein